MKPIIVATIALTFLSTSALADGHATGDATVGEMTYKKCKACHSIVDAEGEVVRKGGKIGPNLFGLYNRIAGTNTDFGDKYGVSIQNAGEQGLMWNEADFVTYVADPKKFLAAYLDEVKAKSKMSYKLKKEDDALNIWAYLVSVGPEAMN